MSEDWLRQRKLERLRERWTLLDEKRATVQQQYDRETREEERLRMKALLDQAQQELHGVEAEMAALGPADASVMRTVLEMDMVGYNDVLHVLEENLGVGASAQLNAQIQHFIKQGLQAVGLPPETVVKTTGDGAILLFEQARDAHGFARALYEAAAAFNSGRKEAKRRFRIGAATGSVQIVNRGGGKDIAGTVIARAVRLEAAARPGELLIDPATYVALPVEIQRLYGPEETIPGKREETYQVQRCRLSPEPAETVSSTPTMDSVLVLLKRLNPRDQLEMIMARLEMPAEHRPPAALALAQRETVMIEWAKGKDGLKRLDAMLREMIAEQG